MCKSIFCEIYRISKRDQSNLYVEKKDDFSRVPEELMMGARNWSMLILKRLNWH